MTLDKIQPLASASLYGSKENYLLTSMIVFKKDSNDKSDHIMGGWAIIGISSIVVSPV